MTGAWMCPTCARTVEDCHQEGCVPAGLTPPKPAWVPEDALAKAEETWVARRSVLPRPKPAWGVSAAEAAHMRGDCDPDGCYRCGLLREMRGEGTA